MTAKGERCVSFLPERDTATRGACAVRVGPCVCLVLVPIERVIQVHVTAICSVLTSVLTSEKLSINHYPG